MKRIATFGVLAAAVALAGCNKDLTRDRVQEMLNADRGSACEAELRFVDGGFERAKRDNRFRLENFRYIAANVPGEQDRWYTPMGGTIQREKNPRKCLPGKAEVTAILDGPIASVKAVEFTEVVSLPPELMHFKDYVLTRYRKRAHFERTDQGWRVAGQ